MDLPQRERDPKLKDAPIAPSHHAGRPRVCVDVVFHHHQEIFVANQIGPPQRDVERERGEEVIQVRHDDAIRARWKNSKLSLSLISERRFDRCHVSGLFWPHEGTVVVTSKEIHLHSMDRVMGRPAKVFKANARREWVNKE